ncbi:MAG: hypothetical protein K8S98_12700 [Planctomycetes bacterium]|nr:hypothetical protein [Planctomycetota bacterium]
MTLDAYDRRQALAAEYAAWMARGDVRPVRAWRWYRGVCALAQLTGLERHEILFGVLEDAVALRQERNDDDGSWAVR